jgi:hypothetical protein
VHFHGDFRHRPEIVYDTFDKDARDRDFEVKLGEGITGYAWEKKQFTFGVLPWQGLTDPKKIEAVEPDRRSAVCIPLFRVDVPRREDARKQPPFGVLVLDSSATIEQLNWANDAAGVRNLGQRWADIFSKLLE